MATLPDDYSPRYIGDLSKPLRHTFTDGNGNPMDLTGVNTALMTFRLHNLGTDQVRTGQGTWTIIQTPADATTKGQASYAWNALDVAQEGPHEIQAFVPFPDGGQHFSVRIIDFLTVL